MTALLRGLSVSEQDKIEEPQQMECESVGYLQMHTWSWTGISLERLQGIPHFSIAWPCYLLLGYVV